MFCEYCGAENADGASFCERCGSPLQQGMPQPDMMQQQGMPQPDMMQQQGMPQPDMMSQQGMPQPDMMSQQGMQQQPMYQNGMPQQPPYQGTVQQQTFYQGNGNVPVVKKSFFLRSHLILLVLVVIAAYGGYSFIKSNYTPESMAELYFKALKNGAFEEAEKYIDWSGANEFTGKDSFEALAKEKMEEISYCKVEEDDDDDGNGYANIEITYRQKGSSENQIATVGMEKTDGKKWFFMPDWKVNISSWMEHDYTILAMPQQTVTLNGIDIEKYATVEDGTKRYVIPKFFPGTYELNVTMDSDIFEDYTEEIYLSEEEYYYVNTAQTVKEDVMKDLMKKAAADFENYISYAYAGKSFDDLKKVLNNEFPESSYENWFRSSYESQEEYYQLDDGEGIISLYLSDISMSAGKPYVEDDNSLSLNVSVSFNADYVTRYISSWSGEVTDNTYSDDYDGSYIYYVYDTSVKQWVIGGINVEKVGY